MRAVTMRAANDESSDGEEDDGIYLQNLQDPSDGTDGEMWRLGSMRYMQLTYPAKLLWQERYFCRWWFFLYYLHRIINVKVGSSPSKRVGFFCFSESPLKVVIMLFYFILKALSVLKISIICPQDFGYAEKWLDKENKMNFKIHDVTDWSKNKHNTHIAR